MNKEAKIFLGVEGTSQARSNVMGVQGAFGALVKTLENVKKLGIETAKAITDIKPLDPRRAVQSAEQTRYSIQRLAIDAGASVDSLTKKFDSIGEQLGISTQEVTGLAGELSRMTLDPKGSVEALQALGVEANNTNRSLSEMTQIGASLHNDLRVPLQDVGEELVRINRIAKEAGTTGGGKGLQQLLAGLGPELSKFDTATDSARQRLEALVALLAGKLPHQQGMAAAGSVLGALSGNAAQIGRYLGRDVHTAEGGIDPSAIFSLWDKVRKTRGEAAQLRVLTKLFGGDRRAALNFLAVGNVGNVDDLAAGRAEAANARRMGIFTPGVAVYDPDRMTDEQRQRIREEMYGPEDKLAGTAAGEARQIDLERENAERRAGEALLKAKDEHRRRFKGNGAARVAHDTAVGVLPGVVQDVVTGLEAGTAAYDARNKGELPAARGADPMDRLVLETERTNELLRNLPQKTGEQLRTDPNQLGVEKGRSRPAN
ncbi:MAG: hypothetical protein U1A78_32260 [Polyangia bacterium]